MVLLLREALQFLFEADPFDLDIVIHSWPWSGQQKPLVKIQSAQVVNIRSAATRHA